MLFAVILFSNRHALRDESRDEEGELVGGLLLGEQQKLEKQRARSLSRVDGSRAGAALLPRLQPGACDCTLVHEKLINYCSSMMKSLVVIIKLVS